MPMVHSQVSSWERICRLGQVIVSGTKYGQSSPYRHSFSDRLKVQRRLQDSASWGGGVGRFLCLVNCKTEAEKCTFF